MPDCLLLGLARGGSAILHCRIRGFCADFTRFWRRQVSRFMCLDSGCTRHAPLPMMGEDIGYDTPLPDLIAGDSSAATTVSSASSNPAPVGVKAAELQPPEAQKCEAEEPTQQQLECRLATLRSLRESFAGWHRHLFGVCYSFISALHLHFQAFLQGKVNPYRELFLVFGLRRRRYLLPQKVEGAGSLRSPIRLLPPDAAYNPLV